MARLPGWPGRTGSGRARAASRPPPPASIPARASAATSRSSNGVTWPRGVLPALVALARYQHDVPLAGAVMARPIAAARSGSIDHPPAALGRDGQDALQHLGQDGQRVLGVGGYHWSRIARSARLDRGRTHQRPLGPVPVAAAAPARWTAAPG